MKEKRRRYFIDRRFQSEFVLKFCIMVMIGSLIFAVSLYIFSSRTLTTSFENSRLVIKSTADYLLPGLLWGGLIVCIITAMASTIIVVLMTHRIAGPIYRFEKYIGDVGSGRLYPDLKIRRKDQFHGLVDSLNKMTDDIRKGIAEINMISKKLDELVEELSKSSNREILLREDIHRIVSELKRDKESLTKALSYFKIE